jgi:nitrogen permease regulator 3-like protein
VQYFDGMATFEEIAYRTGLHRREIDKILQMFDNDVGYILQQLIDRL